MIITRKIEVFICESDKEKVNQYYQKLCKMRNFAKDAANTASSYLFLLDSNMSHTKNDNINNNISIQKSVDCALILKFLKKRYSKSDMLIGLSQFIARNYHNDKKRGMNKRLLRSYNNNIPMPFHKKTFRNFGLREYIGADGNKHEGYFFEVDDIPFQMRFGRDRSKNKDIVERVLNNEYKMYTSYIKLSNKKIFLLLSVDVPQHEYYPVENNPLYAYLDNQTPIICTLDKDAINKGYDNSRLTFIGVKDDYCYRIKQIESAIKRYRINYRYASDNDFNKNEKIISRFQKHKRNYIDTKLHQYSKMLIDTAVSHRCNEIILLNNIDKKQGNNTILQSWSFANLKGKIDYKCKRYGIKLTER